MMTRLLALLFAGCFLSITGFSQGDIAANGSAIFERISRAVAGFQPDTTAAPDDKLTRKIRELRSLKGGFNIEEAIDFKIAEDRQKKEVSQAELDSVAHFFRSGNGKKWLDNAMIWMYRRHFTYKEIKQLVRFYKTSAGQKMAADFPLLMIQSLRAAETIRDRYRQAGKK